MFIFLVNELRNKAVVICKFVVTHNPKLIVLLFVLRLFTNTTSNYYVYPTGQTCQSV